MPRDAIQESEKLNCIFLSLSNTLNPSASTCNPCSSIAVIQPRHPQNPLPPPKAGGHGFEWRWQLRGVRHRSLRQPAPGRRCPGPCPSSLKRGCIRDVTLRTENQRRRKWKMKWELGLCRSLSGLGLGNLQG